VAANRGDRGAPRRLTILAVVTALCYAVGYPVALLGHSNIGWVLVTLGGVLLVALAVLLIRHVHIGR
jgi:hypothetical protein